MITVVETRAYLSKAGQLLSPVERDALVSRLAADPMAGVVILGLKGLRKMRVALDGRGKRGGGRVIY